MSAAVVSVSFAHVPVTVETVFAWMTISSIVPPAPPPPLAPPDSGRMTVSFFVAPGDPIQIASRAREQLIERDARPHAAGCGWSAHRCS